MGAEMCHPSNWLGTTKSLSGEEPSTIRSKVSSYARWHRNCAEELDELEERIVELEHRRDQMKYELGVSADKLEQERAAHHTEVCRELAAGIMKTLPREIRDIIYTHIYDPPIPDSEVVPVVFRRSSSTPKRDYYDQYHKQALPPPQESPKIQEWDLPIYFWDTVVGAAFASELAQKWYETTHFSVSADKIPALINDERGVLATAGAPARHIPREHIRRLTVQLRAQFYVSGQTSYSEESKDPLPWEQYEEARVYRDGLKSLLGPFGVKLKTGFNLRLQIFCGSELALERWLELLGPVVYACKEEGFVVNVHHINDRMRGWGDAPGDWKALSGALMRRSTVTDVSRRFDRGRLEWKARAWQNGFLAPPEGVEMAGKSQRLPVDSQFDRAMEGNPEFQESATDGRDG